MKLAHKFVLGAFLLASLIWVVSLYAVSVSRRALRDSIEHSSAILAAKTMDEVDRMIHSAIDDWLVYSAGPLVRRTLEASNQEFEKFQDVQAYIDEQDRKRQAVRRAAHVSHLALEEHQCPGRGGQGSEVAAANDGPKAY